MGSRATRAAAVEPRLYVFEQFVTGPCNRLPHAASLAVGRPAGRAYNPLFIHGGVGLGKTHLLQAICQRLLEHQPDARIVYLSCDTFVNQFIAAVQAWRHERTSATATATPTCW